MRKSELIKAVALKYDSGRDHAPRVTAQGRGKLAERLVELARREGIPVSEDPDLVEVLAQLDWYQEIPPTLYKAVAEILAFAYRLNRKVKEE
jgi:flagellar biosynthesis protein